MRREKMYLIGYLISVALVIFLMILQSCTVFQPKNELFLNLSKAAAIPIIEEIADVTLDFEKDSIRVQKWTTEEKVRKIVGAKLYEKIAPTAVSSFENQKVQTGLNLQKFSSDSLYFYYYRFRKN